VIIPLKTPTKDYERHWKWVIVFKGCKSADFEGFSYKFQGKMMVTPVQVIGRGILCKEFSYKFLDIIIKHA
jgi:hypothetical protein